MTEPEVLAKTVPTFHLGASPSGEIDDAAVRAEIAAVLEADDTVLGEVYRGVRDGLTDDEIRIARGNERVNFVWNYKRTIRALLDGSLPSAASVAGQTAARFRTLLKTVEFTPGTAHVLRERLAILESRAADPEAQAAEDKKAREATKKAEEHAVPGIYVYTLPHYLRYPYEPESGHTLLKVGHSGASVIQRFNSQRRETVLPEDSVLLRVYPTGPADSGEIERKFLALLDAADHLRRDGRSVGREWFLTTTKFVDKIADILDLERLEVFDPDSLE